MSENFQDNVSYGGSTLAVGGDAIVVGGSNTNAASKSVIFNNSGTSGDLVWGPSANRTISLPDANGVVLLSTQAILSISAGGAQVTSGQIIFSNSNNVSFGINGNTLTGSIATSLTNINFSAGTTSNNLSALVFSNSNNVSFGLNGSTVTATISVPAQTNQTVGLYGLGNTTQNSSTTLDARTLSFNGLGIVTVGYSNGSIQISATTAAQSNQTEGRYAVGNTVGQSSSSTFDARTLSVSGTGNVSVGYSASALVISVPAQTNQTAGLYALGNTTQNSSTTLDARTLSFNGLGIVTVGYSNGSIQISATTPTQTNQTVGLYALGNTTQNSSTTLDARTISYNGLGIVTVGYSNGSVQISATTPSQTNQTIGLYALGNTTQNSSTTLDARTLSFNGLGLASVGYSNGSIQISVPAGAPSPVNFSAGTTSGNLGSVVFSNSNGVSFGLNGSIITASAAGGGQTTAGFYATGNTTQNSSTTLALNSISFNGIGALTVGYSNSSIQLSAPATSSLVGVGGVIVSTNGSTISISGENYTNFEPQELLNAIAFTASQNSWFIEPFALPANLSGGRLNQIYNFGTNTASGGSVFPITNSASFGTGTSGSLSNGFTFINSGALYSLDVGTNSTRLASFWSNTFSIGLNRSMSISEAGGTAISVSIGNSMSYVGAIDISGNYTTSSFGTSATKSTASSAMNTTAVSSLFSSLWAFLSGQIILPLGFNTTIGPGNYWFAHAVSTSSSSAGSNFPVYTFSNMTQYSIATLTSNSRFWGQTTTANSQLYPGAGSYSATSASPPSTINFTQIKAVTLGRQYFNFFASTL